MWFGELEAVRIALGGKPVYNRASGITQPHHLGALVEGLTDSIVYGLAQNFKVKRAVNPYYLGIAS